MDARNDREAPAGHGSAEPGHDPDLALVVRVARGESRARRTLVQRLVVRVRRGANALLGPAAESDAAAVVALLEIVRASTTYQSALGLHAWADRIAARSIVRFGHVSQPVRTPRDLMRVPASSLEDLFAKLPAAARVVFVLVHVFGLPMREVVSLTGLTEIGVREELEVARRGLVGMAVGASNGEPELAALRHVWALFDRAGHGYGEAAPPSARLPAQLGELGPWVAPLLRALDQAAAYLDRAQRMRMAGPDRQVLARVLSGLDAERALEETVAEHGAARRGSPDPEGSRWVPVFSVGVSVAMLLGAFVALGYHTPHVTPPRATPRAAAGPAPRPAAAVPPTVEALPKAASTRRGAPLLRADRQLAPETPLYEGDVLRASDAPGCARLEPATEVCIGPGSELALRKLARGERVLELLRGRAVVALEAVTVPLRAVAGPITLKAERGTFGLERDEAGTVVRALQGRAEVEAYGQAQELSTESLLARAQSSSVERFALLPEKARRDWELFAAHRPAGSKSASTARPGADEASPGEEARVELAPAERSAP